MRPAGFVALAVLLSSCAPGAPEGRRCVLHVGYRPHRLAAPVAPEQLWGSWDDFTQPAPVEFRDAIDAGGRPWRHAELRLPPGVYRYYLQIDEATRLDEINPHSAFEGGLEVSELDLSTCDAAGIVVTDRVAAPDALTVRARLERGDGGAYLLGETVAASLWRGPDRLGEPSLRLAGDALEVTATGLSPGKYTVELTGRASDGREARARAAVFVEALPNRGRGDGLVYHLLVDRFQGAQGPLAPPASPGDRAGGTLDGVRRLVEAGYFEHLGVTTLWLSPVYRNPEGRLIGRDGHVYEAYHGYWPTAPREVEPKLGGEAQLDALVAAAHARGLRIVLDVVPNHVHESHPWYRAHGRSAGGTWFNDGPDTCVCGGPGCGWAEHIDHCWFDTYLPDVDWRNPEVVAAGLDDLRWWMDRFDVDGVRIDAVPMMPRAATRRMAQALRERVFADGLDLLVLGENFTGPGEPGRAALRTFLGRAYDGLDSAFEFPIMWELKRVIAHGDGGLDDLEREIAASRAAFAGSGSLMAHIIDNHDLPRFVSEAARQQIQHPWTAPPEQPREAAPYRRQLMALTVALTLPGLPILYYGDELGLAGATDPDSRRVMPDESALLPPQQALRDAVGRLGRLRRCLPALRGEQRQPLVANAEHLASLHLPPHPGDGDPAVVLIARTGGVVTLRGIPDGDWRDALSGRRFTAQGGTALVPVDDLDSAVYLPEASPCAE